MTTSSWTIFYVAQQSLYQCKTKCQRYCQCLGAFQSTIWWSFALLPQSNPQCVQHTSTKFRNTEVQGKGMSKVPHTEVSMQSCPTPNCNKIVHKACYKYIVCNARRTSLDKMSSCTCAHHNEFVKNMSNANLSCTIDNANGCDDPLTSQHYLIKLLSTGENTKYWSPSSGQTKIDMVSWVAA